MEQPPEIPQSSVATQDKKGMPVIAWVGIGCGGLIILGIIVTVILFKLFAGKIREFSENPEKTAAELVVAADPNLRKSFAK